MKGYLTIPSEDLEGLSYAAYTAFIVAALTEEGMKFLAFYFFFWKNRNFNERFDGIVYAVYISLGFAGIENILYVFTGGYSVGVIRALTAVPAHALFGIVMGYYFGMAKFNPGRTYNLPGSGFLSALSVSRIIRFSANGKFAGSSDNIYSCIYLLLDHRIQKDVYSLRCFCLSENRQMMRCNHRRS